MHSEQGADPQLLEQLVTAKAALEDAITEIRHSRRVNDRQVFAGVKMIQFGVESLAEATGD